MPKGIDAAVSHAIARLPKAELHLHLEGAIAAETVAELASRHGERVNAETARERYRYADFAGFLEAFKWVTSYLREPRDYALIARRLAEELQRQGVVYAEVTLSVAVMLRRGQDVDANFESLAEAATEMRSRGLELAWIFDTTRQFGAEVARGVARLAAKHRSRGVAAFGMGGDELSLPATDFAAAFRLAREAGLHTVTHAGEIGGAEEIRAAIEVLGAERIGHGIAAIHDSDVCHQLIQRKIALEICPTSNVKTGALARQIGKTHAGIEAHPLATLYGAGVGIVLSTDDPAMFHTDLLEEYGIAARLGMAPAEILRLARGSFEFAFLEEERKSLLLEDFDRRAQELLLV